MLTGRSRSTFFVRTYLTEQKTTFGEFKFRMLNEIFESYDWSVERIEDREKRMISVIKVRWPDSVAEEAESQTLPAEDD